MVLFLFNQGTVPGARYSEHVVLVSCWLVHLAFNFVQLLLMALVTDVKATTLHHAQLHSVSSILRPIGQLGF